MTIDEVIISLKDCSNETDKQIAEWLEELKAYKTCNEGKFIHYIEESNYNKALDDVESEFLKCDKVHYNLQDILCVINKLKAGVENEQSI